MPAAVDADTLTDEDKINLAVFKRKTRFAKEAFDFGLHLMPLTQARL